MRGGSGNDHIYGDYDSMSSYNPGTIPAEWRDYLYGDEGDDTIYGDTPGAQSVAGATGGFDYMYGGPDTDYLWGEGGNDQIYGESGVDFLFGGNGDDSLFANDGEEDAVYGGDGWDTASYDWHPTDPNLRDAVGDDVEAPPPSSRQ